MGHRYTDELPITVGRLRACANGRTSVTSALPLVLYVASTRNVDDGYFIDEFYYIACAKRLAFGYASPTPGGGAARSASSSLNRPTLRSNARLASSTRRAASPSASGMASRPSR